MSSEEWPVGRPADTDAEVDADRVALDELLRAFAIDATRVAEEDRTDSEIDRHVDEVLGDPEPDGSDPDGSVADGSVGADPEPPIDVAAVTHAPNGASASEAPLGDDAATPSHPTQPPPSSTNVPGNVPGSVPGNVKVIAIADDEYPPDAVYVEGDLGGPDTSGDRPVVFIDDDVVVTETPEDSRRLRRRIEPRLRDRRIAVRRAESRRRLRWVFLAVFVLLVAGAALAVLGSSLFAIEADQVSVSGNVYTDRVRLQAVVDDLVGTPVLAADTQAAERELEEIPWVDQARVRTRFPHGVNIEIRERVALATYAGPDGQFRVIDSDGRVLDVISGQPIAYMLITGPDPVDRQPGEYAPVGYGAAARLVQGLTGSVRGRVQSIDVTADGSQLRLLLDDATEVRFGAASDLVTKLVRLETALGATGDQVVSVIDVSTAEVVMR
ncbi:MAG TPA: FtsQ-type POTRA domain-containing protein [Ilumatobacteraceae bacterium]|nr:FtsQ-type POTRA domain-containing protein [Ilumatobacteraceae bacterium]